MGTRRGRIRVPWRQHLVDCLRGPIPFVVWLAAGFGSYQLWKTQHRVRVLSGLAYAPQAMVTSPGSGTLRELAVHWSDAVNAGDVLGTLDDSVLKARLDAAHARIAQIEAAAAAAAEEFDQARSDSLSAQDTERVQELRRFIADETDLELRCLELRVDLESDRIEEQRVAAQWRRAERLASLEVGEVATAEDLGLEREQVRQRIDELERLLELTQSECEAARERREAYSTRAPRLVAAYQARLQAIRAQIAVENTMIAELVVLRDQLIIRAPIAGRVLGLGPEESAGAPLPARVLEVPAGCNVVVGQPLATIVGENADRVIAYLPELEDPALLRENQTVSILHSDRSRAPIEGRVLSVTSSIEEIPMRFWRRPNLPEFGRAISIGFAPGVRLVHGQRITIQVD